MTCIICTSGASNGFFSSLFNMQLGVTTFYSVLMLLVLVAVFAAYRIGVAYTRQTEREVRESREALRKLAGNSNVR